MAQPATQPKLSLAHNADRDANGAGAQDLYAIKEAIARAEAETSATLAAETRGAWESHARTRATRLKNAGKI